MTAAAVAPSIPPKSRLRDHSLFLLSLLVFLTSGIAALVYQVIWQRMLAMFSGADVFSVTIIVAAFMAGLGIGSLFGGHIADRISRRRCLHLFALAEFAIAAFAWLSKPLYYDWLYGRHADLAASPLILTITLFLSLLPPTLCMGVSLPLLVRGVTSSIDSAALRIGWLYGFNTLGSAAGSLGAVLWLLRTFDFETALRVTSLLNVAAALIVLPFARRRSASAVAVRSGAEGGDLTDSPPVTPAASGEVGTCADDRVEVVVPDSKREDRAALQSPQSTASAGEEPSVNDRGERVAAGRDRKDRAASQSPQSTTSTGDLSSGKDRGEVVATGNDRDGLAALVSVQVATSTGSIRKWLMIYALSGFIALALEVVWFRALTVMLKSTAFTFGILLAFYLAGIGLGTILGAPFARRSRHPERVFLRMQAAIGLYAGVILAVFVAGLGRWRFLDLYWDYFAEYEPLDIAAVAEALARQLNGEVVEGTLRYVGTRFLWLYGFLPLVLIFPSCFLMGASFPFLQRAVQTDAARLGRRVGWLQTANIVGSLAGTGMTGWLLLPWLGTAGTLKVLFASSTMFIALLPPRSATSRRRNLIFAASIALAGVIFLPGSAKLWSSLHGTHADKIIWAEDGSGLSVLSRGRIDTDQTAVFCNGRGESWIPFGGVHSVLGFLPALIHPEPKDVAVIGLGSADTLFHIAGRTETRSITSLEIVAPQLTTLHELAARDHYPALEAILADPRVRHEFTDGRAYLRRGLRRYDIIEADALRPNSAYSGNLYSKEYFDLLKDHLTPGGLAVTWIPTPRIRNTFLSVFPYVNIVGVIAIGSNQPIPWNKTDILHRLDDPHLTAWYAKAGPLDLRQLVDTTFDLARPEVFTPAFDRSHLTDLNHDLHPKDEYMVQ